MIAIAAKQERLKQYLLNRIIAGELAGGQRLPPERELAERLNVSRATVRLALGELEEMALVERRHGVGNFVAEKAGLKVQRLSQPALLAATFVMSPDFFYNPVIRSQFEAFAARLDPRCGARLEFHERLDSPRFPEAAADVLIVQGSYPEEAIQRLGKRRPLVTLNRKTRHGNFIVTDNFQGGYLMAEHLIRRGHAEAGCVTYAPGPEVTDEMGHRFAGIQQAFREYGLPSPTVACLEDGRAAPGERALAALLGRRPKMTAILCLTDLMAAHMYAALAARGLRIPDDMSVVGYDDQTYDRYLAPALTSVRQLTERMGRTLADAVNATLDSAPLELREEVAPVLNELESVRDV